MALPLPPGLTPSECAFLCEMELVTVIPRQRLESLDLMTGPTPTARPPTRTTVPLWLALLLHRQRRANIIPPPWLTIASLTHILDFETSNPSTFSPHPAWPPPKPASQLTPSPPFLATSTAPTAATSSVAQLPYHYLELSNILLAALGADDDMPSATASALRNLLRSIREVRASKLRARIRDVQGGGVMSLRGIGALELAGERGFVVGIVGGLRALGASKERERRERDEAGESESEDEMDVEL